MDYISVRQKWKKIAKQWSEMSEFTNQNMETEKEPGQR